MSSDCCDGEVKSRYISKGEGGSDGEFGGESGAAMDDDEPGGRGAVGSLATSM